MAALDPILNILCTFVANLDSLGYLSSLYNLGIAVWKQSAVENMAIEAAIALILLGQ